MSKLIYMVEFQECVLVDCGVHANADLLVRNVQHVCGGLHGS
jgi:hypothetical protein